MRKKIDLKGASVNIYDTVGLCDREITNEEIIKTLRASECPVKELDLMIVCFRWDDRFVGANAKVFDVINEMNPDLWKKTIFALTHCDCVPPGFERKCGPDREAFSIVLHSEWRVNLWQNIFSFDGEEFRPTIALITGVAVMNNNESGLEAILNHIPLVSSGIAAAVGINSVGADLASIGTISEATAASLTALGPALGFVIPIAARAVAFGLFLTWLYIYKMTNN